MKQSEVSVALDILLEVIESDIDMLNREGAQAFQAGKYDVARELMEKVSKVSDFRTRVLDLQKEWSHILAGVGNSRIRRHRRIVAARLGCGLRTPESEFWVPILKTLVDLGGSAPMSVVLDNVETLMKDRLNAYDRLPLPSDPTHVRWRNTAQWARMAMVKESLLSEDSPRGIWEVTSAGRRWLASAIERQ